MKNQQPLANLRLHAIGLALTAVLASCTPLEQPTVVPTATEMPTQSSTMSETMQETLPEIIPVASNLACPSIPSTDAILPPAPYDEELGDCALVGRSGEIEAWLTELEQIAASCHASRETNWADTLAARENLDSQIDELQVVEDIQDPSQVLMASESCPIYGNIEPLEPSRPIPPPTHYYTNWLKTIGENVVEYCTMIDELVEPLWQACDEINFYQECQAPNPEQYHSIVEWKMNAAQINHDYTDFFYTNTLQTYGWGNFRMYFDEAYINCAPVQQATSIPMFTFSNNAFCRKGPSSAYEDVTAFLQGQSVQIDGRNQDEPRWWWVLVPGTSAHCWVSDSTGSAAGLLEDVKTVAAPPLPTPTPVCTRDLPQTQCEAAGGTWRQDPNILTAVVYFCDCSD
jgi:hypothetical protein